MSNASAHRAEPSGGDHEYPRAPAVVDDRHAQGEMAVEPFEAQGGRGIRAGAEREAEIERDGDCAKGLHPLVDRADVDVQALAEAHCVEVA